MALIVWGSLKCKPHRSSLVPLQCWLKIQSKKLNYLMFKQSASRMKEVSLLDGAAGY